MGKKSLAGRAYRRVSKSFSEALRLISTPISWKANKKTQKGTKQEKWLSWSKLNKFLFPNLPEHYPIKKKLLLAMNSTPIGAFWNAFQIILSIMGCILYVYESYGGSYNQIQLYFVFEVIITQFFLLDFILSCIVASSWRKQLTSIMTWVDIAIILPVFFNLIIDRGSPATHLVLKFFC